MNTPFDLSPILSDALVILGAAGIIIPLFARFRVTPIIGFVLVGIVVGPFGLGQLVESHRWLSHFTISDPAGLQPFADFGIVLLLFSIGLGLSFSTLRKMRRLVFGLGALEVLVIGAVLAIALAVAGYQASAALALGFALAFSSTAIVLPISGTTSPVGSAAFSMLLFEGIALVPIIFVLGALAPKAQAGGWDGLATTLWQGALVIAILLLAGRFVLPGLFAQAARTKSPELFLSAALLVVITASLATAAVGLSSIVGALIAGILIAETDYSPEVASIMEPFKGLALGIFLLTIGMSIDLDFVQSHIGSILMALAIVLAFKAIVTMILLVMMGARRGTAAETGIMMASPSEDTLIVLAAASAAAIISAQTAQFWQVVTAIGLSITPLLARLGRLIARRLEPAPDFVAIEGADQAPPVIIIGMGRVGRLVAHMLSRHSKPYIGIEADPDLADKGRQEGYRVIFGNAMRGDVLEKMGLDKAPAVILTMDEHVFAQRLVKKLRGAHPDLPIIARARDTHHAAELYLAGASHAVPETLESSLQLSEAVLVELGVGVGPVIASIHEKREEMRDLIQQGAGLEKRPQLRTSAFVPKLHAGPAPGPARGPAPDLDPTGSANLA